MSRKYFGTDGVRGPYGGPLVNEDFAARLGCAAAAWVLRQTGTATAPSPRVLIGRDTRASGGALETAIARGFRAAGMEPFSLGICPTPAVARAVRLQGAGLGVVITASHNPAGDNGIKFFNSSGVKLTDEQELTIEHLLPGTVAAPAAPLAQVDVIRDYTSALSLLLPAGALSGWRIVLDTANGATCATSPQVLRNLGAEVVGIGNMPDGSNINARVGSEHPEQLAAAVRAERARIGVAHDGDGDRCVLCDEQGDVLDGDEILTLLGLFALQRNALVRNTLVVTVQSNMGVDAALAAAGGRVVRTPVGDRYVIERMLVEGATLGGESSGHIVCSEVSTTGDGLVAALKVLQVMVNTRKPLSELRRVLRKFPQATAALKAAQRKPLSELPRLVSVIAELEREFGGDGRVLVRWSGTEPKLRLLVEGRTEALVRSGMERLQQVAKAELGG